MEVGSAGSVKGMEKWNAMIVMVVEIAIIVMDMAKIHVVNVMVKAVKGVTSVEVPVHAGNVAVQARYGVRTAVAKESWRKCIRGNINHIWINVQSAEVPAMLNAQIALGYLAEAAESVKSAKDQVNWSVANVTDLAK